MRRATLTSALTKALYGPPNFFVTKFSAEDRRMFGFWMLVISIVLYPWLGGNVRYIGALSVVALVPNYTTETPVEEE
jgi:hypothetical protein